MALGTRVDADELVHDDRARGTTGADPALLQGVQRDREHDDGGRSDTRALPVQQRITHAYVTWSRSNPSRRTVRPRSTFTTPFSTRTGWVSSGRGAGGFATTPRRSNGCEREH